MKKRMLKISEYANMQAIRQKIKNSFSEKGAEVAQAITALIDEIEASEVEVDEVAFAEKVKEILSSISEEEIPEAVADAITKRFTAMQSAMPVTDKITAKVKNEISASILRQKNADEKSVKNAIEEVLIKNNITGYTFADVIDFAVTTKWQDLNPFFAQLHPTFYSKFFYTDADMATANILAKQWDKTGATEKKVQELAVTGKTISTKYVYKRQKAAFEDLDEIEQAGEMSNFLTWLNTEIDTMIINTIVMSILVGDGVNAVGDRVTTFESIGTKTVTDPFTKVTALASGTTVTLQHLRALSDGVLNPNGKRKVLVISQALLTAVSQFTYASGGTITYLSKEELAGQVGVDEIFVTDILTAFTGAGTIAAEVIIPEGYWYKEKKYLSLAYPTYEKNVQNYQKERNIGGAIHDLYSTAVLKINA